MPRKKKTDLGPVSYSDMVQELKEQVKKLQEDVQMFKRQTAEIKNIAQKQGTEYFNHKKKCVLLEEENNKLRSELDFIKKKYKVRN